MSFVSGVIINILEKELSSRSPELEAYILSLLGEVAKDLVVYIEKKIGMQPQAPVPPLS